MADMRLKVGFDSMQSRPHLHASLDYKILTEIHQVALICSEWDDLLSRSRCNRAFNCSKWYLATVEFLPHLQPLVFTAQRAGVLAGVLPLWLDVNKRQAKFGDYYSDHQDIIAADEDSEVIAGLLDLALHGTGAYDRLVPGQIRHDSNYVKAGKALGLGEAIDEFFSPGKALIYAVVDLTCGYDDYMKTLGRQFRFNLNCDFKRAERDGLVVCELTPTELRPELLAETFLSLHLSRFGDRSDFRSAESWVQNLFPSLFAERRMRAFAVLDKSRIVGIDLAAVTRFGMFAYNVGFLPEMRRYAPGKLMIHQGIRQACLEGMAEYDLGWWGQDHKAHWRPTGREVGQIQFPTRSCLQSSREPPKVVP